MVRALQDKRRGRGLRAPPPPPVGTNARAGEKRKANKTDFDQVLEKNSALFKSVPVVQEGEEEGADYYWSEAEEE